MRQRFDSTVTEQVYQNGYKSNIDMSKEYGSEIELNNNPVVIKNDDNYEKHNVNFGTDFNFKRKIVWFNVIGFAILHLLAIYGYYLFYSKAKLYTIIWAFFLGFVSGEGITIGAHRMWTHKSIKGKFITRFVLMILQTVAGQNCIWIWARDHRQHHRYTDTDADPHNAVRGFFFSHIGWLMTRKHPLVKNMGKTIDMSDLEADELVMFQKKYYKTLYIIFAITIPVMIPVYFWKEDLLTSFIISYITRSVTLLNGTWLVNSVAHLWGTKPYDKNIMAVESLFVSFITSGEGWHNYHHTFPWDYKAAEYGTHYQVTTHIINALAAFGLFYELRQASPKVIQSRLLRTGDRSYEPKFK